MTSIRNSTTAKIKKIRDALAPLDVIAPVNHYRKPTDSKAGRYIVWAEDGGQNFGANNRNGEREITGTIDLYTLHEYDVLVDMIEDALNGGNHIIWNLNAVDYDDETNLIHYEWIFSVA